MSNSTTHLFPLNFNDPKFQKKNSLKISIRRTYNKEDSILAPKFKYETNYPVKDIEEIRNLLTIERANQSDEEYQFWTPDYERMMIDDWLVTRFLLRGLKASNKQGKGDDKVAVYQQTMNLIRSCAKFRREYKVNGLTKESEFPVEWLKTNGLFNYKQDLSGNPTIYLRIKLHKPKLIEKDELKNNFKRLLLFTLEKCDQDLLNNPGKGVCCIFDMSDATFENVDLEMMSWMIRSFKNCSPKLLCYVIVYNLPWFFSATFKFISSTLMSNSNKQCLKFVYGDEILNYIDRNNLPDYMRD